ncbi:MAG: ADOP family duplicated permease [Vicinamibacteraceae bacterium]
MMRSLWWRVRGMFRRGHDGGELDAEIRVHLRMAEAEHRRSGLSPEEARRAASRDFGNLARVRETCYEQRGLPLIDTAVQDLRFAGRSLWQHRSFSLTAVATLALGIGAGTLVFSVTKAVLLRPLPYPQPEQLVLMWGQSDTSHSASVSAADFLDYRAQATSFAEISAAQSFNGPMNLTGAGEPERVRVALVASNLFDVFQMRPMIGSGFVARYEDETSPTAAVLSYELWQRRYGGRRDVVGKAVTLDGLAVTTVGVMPRGAWFPANTDVWVSRPFGGAEWRSRSAHNLRPVGRLKPNVTLRKAGQELDVIAARLAQQYPDTNKGWQLRLEPLHEALLGRARRPLIALTIAVVMLLLIACANVANLVMARGAGRQRELATRAALGAGRARLVRLLMSESCVVALAGGALGTLLAFGGVRIVRAIELGALPRLTETTIDASVLGFALALSVSTVFLFGLLPAVFTVRRRALGLLRPGPVIGRRSGHGVSRSLVGVQIAVSLVLLVGAGLIARSLSTLLAVDPGFNLAGALTVQLARPLSSDPASRRTFFQEVVDRTAQLPGVEATGLVSELPLAFEFNDLYVHLEGRPPESLAERTVADYRRISAGYFKAMGIPFRRGRLPTGTDVRLSTPVALIDETLAERFFDGEDPIGQHLLVGLDGGETRLEVIGVVGSVLPALWSSPRPTVYVPDLETPISMTLVLRTSGPPADLGSSLRETLTNIDRDQPLSSFRTLQDVASAGLSAPRLIVRLLNLFSMLGLVLAAVGIYGMLTFATARRTSEIGLRMALGASRRHVLALVVGDGMRVVAVAMAVGLVGALAIGRVATSFLFGVSPHDTLTLTVAVLVLSGVCLLGSYLPARRASHVDAAMAIRHE